MAHIVIKKNIETTNRERFVLQQALTLLIDSNRLNPINTKTANELIEKIKIARNETNEG